MLSPKDRIAAEIHAAHQHFRDLQKVQKALLTDQKISYEDPEDASDHTLRCPCCGNANLHHSVVDVYDCIEDGPDTLTSNRNPNLLHDMSYKNPEHPPTKNPSSRRHGLVVGLYCEHCPALSELRVAQDRGATFLTICVVGTRSK